MDILTNRVVITRKPHNCWGCAREHPPKSKLRLIESVDGDGFSRSYWCEVCEEVINESGYSDNEYGYGDVRGSFDEWEEVRAGIEDE